MSEKTQTADGQAELIDLMRDPSTASRLAVARRALRFAPEDSIPVIEEIAAGDGVPRIVALDLLQRFRRGLWDVDHDEPADLTGENLDRTLEAHSLVMNGGLFHAWNVNRPNYWLAQRVFREVGRRDVWTLLSGVDAMFSAEGALNSEGELTDGFYADQEQASTAQYYELPDPQRSIEVIEATDE